MAIVTQSYNIGGGGTAIVLTNQSGNIIVDSALIGKTVSFIIINDIVKNRPIDFTKPVNSDTITFQDGTLVYSTDYITVFCIN